MDQEIHRGLICYIRSISLKGLRKNTTRFIEDLLSIFPFRYLLKAEGNTGKQTPRSIEDLLSIFFLKYNIYQRLKQIDHEIHRGIIVYIPSQISIKSLRKQKGIDREIHRGLIVYIPSQISLKSLRKQTRRFIEDLLCIFLVGHLLKA